MSRYDPSSRHGDLSPMERVVSIAGGVLLIRKGMAIKGPLGLTDIAAGALGLFRGITGICPAKRWLRPGARTAAGQALPPVLRLVKRHGA